MFSFKLYRIVELTRLNKISSLTNYMVHIFLLYIYQAVAQPWVKHSGDRELTIPENSLSYSG